MPPHVNIYFGLYAGRGGGVRMLGYIVAYDGAYHVNGMVCLGAYNITLKTSVALHGHTHMSHTYSRGNFA